METTLNDRYFIKRKATDAWTDVCAAFNGVKILAIDGFNEQGDAVNVYTAQWVNRQNEDFLVTTQEAGRDVIIRQNVDLQMTFIAGPRFAGYATPEVDDTQAIYNTFVDYIAKGGDFYIRSSYTGKEAHVVCLKSFKPTTQRLHRGSRSYILATAPLHCLDDPQVYS